MNNLSRRSLIGSATGAASAALLPGASAHAVPPQSLPFSLRATVFDGGQQVSGIVITAWSLPAIDPESITPSTFTVQAKASAPPGLPEGASVSGYASTREVTEAVLGPRQQIDIQLRSGPGVWGADTLGFAEAIFRNVELDLDYDITLRSPIRLRDGREIGTLEFNQGSLLDHEVDAFTRGTASNGVKYRLYEPRAKRRDEEDQRRPLVVWLHGAGEGGHAGLYTNHTHLAANRGALGFATAEAQAVFDGAFVLAPQAPADWGTGQVTQSLKKVIDEVIAATNADPQRVHIAGNSSGGFMTVEMAQAYPDFFASCVPVCAPTTGFTRDQLLRLGSTPTWFVAAANDASVPAEQNSVAAHKLLPSSRLSLYPNVVWDGHEYNGHWAWIYVAHNDPVSDGVRLWNWMAAQRR